MPSVEAIVEEMRRNPRNIRFAELCKVCEAYFGKPRISGSHHYFRNIWSVDPRICLQRDGSKAKEYQVQQVLKAIKDAEYIGKGPQHV